jgi:hypothetical protein
VDACWLRAGLEVLRGDGLEFGWRGSSRRSPDSVQTCLGHVRDDDLSHCEARADSHLLFRRDFAGVVMGYAAKVFTTIVERCASYA